MMLVTALTSANWSKFTGCILLSDPCTPPLCCSSSEVDGEMWCYQKPGFEALLLAELQRQQQRSQFCDTLLKTEGSYSPDKTCI